MYVVADNMERLDMLAEIQISAYTNDDIEYMTALLCTHLELVSEGAAFTLYTSCKALIAQIASVYQERCYDKPYSTDIPKEVRLTFYNLSRKNLPDLLKQYQEKYGDIELYISRKLCILYERIIKYNLGIDFSQKI